MLKSLISATALLASICSYSTAAAEATAFVGVHVLPMDDERVLHDQTVIVEDGRITIVGPQAQTTTPPDAQIINGDGQYLMPGLAEMHGHLPGGGADAHDILFLYVSRGVTTVRGMLGQQGQFTLRDQINAGDLVGPTLYLAAPVISGNNTPSVEGGPGESSAI